MIAKHMIKRRDKANILFEEKLSEAIDATQCEAEQGLQYLLRKTRRNTKIFIIVCIWFGYFTSEEYLIL